MDCKIVTIPGDGIGPEIVREACKVLDRVGEVYGHKFNYTPYASMEQPPIRDPDGRLFH